MAKTILEIAPEMRAAYRPLQAVRSRQERGDPQLDERWQRARRLAAQAAQILYDEFDVDAVILFGSTAHRPLFNHWSDVDLAIRGIVPERYYAAVAVVTGLSKEFQVDLVDLEQCNATLQAEIERAGLVL
jgi:predicted nucleotidyltransferase